MGRDFAIAFAFFVTIAVCCLYGFFYVCDELEGWWTAPTLILLAFTSIASGVFAIATVGAYVESTKDDKD
jgi:UPF0716 family protein affecting phage T7 exclusion